MERPCSGELQMVSWERKAGGDVVPKRPSSQCCVIGGQRTEKPTVCSQLALHLGGPTSMCQKRVMTCCSYDTARLQDRKGWPAQTPAAEPGVSEF
jgi:hypothetical protein